MFVKNFAEFQALYKSMCEIHRTLYLKGKFPPPLPKSNNSYFKSSDSPGLNTIRIKFHLYLSVTLNRGNFATICTRKPSVGGSVKLTKMLVNELFFMAPGQFITEPRITRRPIHHKLFWLLPFW